MADQHRVTNVIVIGREKSATSIKEVGNSRRTRSKGALMRTFATHQCGLDSNSSVSGYNYVGRVCRWFSPLHREVFRVLQFFLSPQKSTLPNFNLVWKAQTPLNEFLRSPKCVTVNILQDLTSQRTPVYRECPGKEEVVSLIICVKMK